MPTRTWLSINKNGLNKCLNTLIDLERECIDHFKKKKNNIPMQRLSHAKQEQYNNAIQCHICRKPFQGDKDPTGPKVHYHDNVTKHFIGVANRQCNLQRRVNYQIPIFFHNFREYDLQFIVHEFPNYQNRKLMVIVFNIEKYYQIEWGRTSCSAASSNFYRPHLTNLPSHLQSQGGIISSISIRQFETLFRM